MKTRYHLAKRSDQHESASHRNERQGFILVVASVLLIVVFAFVAFTVDIGYITMTEAEMQNAADAGVLAAASEIRRAMEENNTNSQGPARDAAEQLVMLNSNGNHAQTVIMPGRDVEFGHVTWEPITGTWQTTWGLAPHNVARVTLQRRAAEGTGLPLFIAPMIGSDTANLTVTATAAVLPAAGYRIAEESSARAMILPFAVDIDRWLLTLGGAGFDRYSYNDGTKTVCTAADGVVEINIYPMRDGSLPAGNSGTVNLGDPNNSTADISRQIVEGLNYTDMSFFGGELSTEQGPLTVSGDPGISAAFEDDLKSIIGQTRSIPMYTFVDGQGANTQYEVVKFVGCRIMAVKLTGPMAQKHLIVQPEQVHDSTAIHKKEWVVGVDTVFASPILIE